MQIALPAAPEWVEGPARRDATRVARRVSETPSGRLGMRPTQKPQKLPLALLANHTHKNTNR